MHEPIPPELDALARQVVDSAFRVHTELGPGLLESVYETCLADELAIRGLASARQVPIPITYRGKRLEGGFRADLIVEDVIIVEIKSTESLLPIHEAQTLTYLRLAGRRLGFLVNFNVKMLKQGIRRFAI